MNLLKKFYIKYKDYEAYKNLKFLYALDNLPDTININTQFPDEIHFKHSGNIGDIIYAIPAIYELAKTKKIHLHLAINQRGIYGKNIHPLGNVMLNEKMVAMLKPLLLSQPQITNCDIYTNQAIDIDLDIFRKFPLNQKAGNIARWYFLVFGITFNLGNPWLEVLPDLRLNDTIVIARSQRYRSPGITYSFLSKYPKILFLGIEEEYADIKKQIFEIEYRPVENFSELASIIAGCKFFIGNQSFPFAIAESLKVKRLLEVYHQSPNVIVEGHNGYDFCFQKQFERLVEKLYYED